MWTHPSRFQTRGCRIKPKEALGRECGHGLAWRLYRFPHCASHRLTRSFFALECVWYHLTKKTFQALVIGVAATAPLAFALPGHSIETCRNGSGTLSSYSAAEIQATGFTCQLGDKIYSDFDIASITSGSFIMTNPLPNFHTFQGSGLGLSDGTAISYAYKVAIDMSLAPTHKMLNYSTSTTVSDYGTGLVSVKSLEDYFVLGSTVNSINGVNSATHAYAPPVSGPITFVSNITVTKGILTQFTDNLTQTEVPPPVPGPLPILGAAIAFGSSRQLRNRIRKLS